MKIEEKIDQAIGSSEDWFYEGRRILSFEEAVSRLKEAIAGLPDVMPTGQRERVGKITRAIINAQFHILEAADVLKEISAQNKICSASDCEKTFRPSPDKLESQLYCSTTCGARMAKQRERARKKVGWEQYGHEGLTGEDFVEL